VSSPSYIFVQQYKAAAAEGAVVELSLRLLADKVPELQSFAHDQRLEDVETLIVTHFAASLSEEEKTTLKVCRQLRNKILHCDFRAARQKLEQSGVAAQRGNVRKIDIRGLSAEQIREKIKTVASGAEGTFEYVADAPAQPGSVFAWLLEVGVAGDFVRAAQVFVRGTAIVDRLVRS
jgi:hypothetical protein